MSGGMIQFWFCALFFLFLALFFGALLALKRRFSPKEAPYRPVTLTRRKKQRTFEDDIADCQALVLESVEMMENAPSIEQIEKQQQKKRTYSMFDKFKASRAKRKQAPTSQATPNIKSLRGRKV